MITAAHILKFNPFHDEAGRFASRGATTFVSPNVLEGTSVTQGAAKTHSYEQRKYRDLFNKVDDLIGLKGVSKSALGAWSDGGENSIGTEYTGADYRAVQASAAMKGLLAQQKAVVTYRTQAGGPSRMHKISGVPISDPDMLSRALVEGGVPHHTLIRSKSGKGYDIHVFEENKGVRLNNRILRFAESFGVEATHTDGRGSFVGSWGSREEGRKKYEKVINSYLKDHPAKKAAWNTMLALHKFRAVKAASMMLGAIL